LVAFEFLQAGNFHRVRFYRCQRPEPAQLNLLDSNAGSEQENNPDDDLWAVIVAQLPDDRFPPKLAGTRLICIEDGTATIAGGPFRDWCKFRLSNQQNSGLKISQKGVTVFG
jgi:hypothetical protein